MQDEEQADPKMVRVTMEPLIRSRKTGPGESVEGREGKGKTYRC